MTGTGYNIYYVFKDLKFAFLLFTVTLVQPYIVSKQLKIEGFLVNRYAERTMEGIKQNLQWVKDGKLKYREHIYDGFESAVDAFTGLFSGDNIGKALVKVK